MRKIVFALFVTLVLSFVCHAQDKTPRTGDDPYKQARAVSNQAQANLVESTNTSPNPVPKGSDHLFYKDEQAGVLDNYTCRSGSPLTITIPINRVISKFDPQTNASQYGDVLGWHLNNGTLSNLKIKLPVYDIDPTEVDKVYFNGEYVGNLYGKNDEWEINEFNVPISKVKFGKYRDIENTPLDGNNEIKIEIDTLDEGWCASVDWISLSFETFSPIVLIHGNGSDHGFFSRRGLLRTLEVSQRLLVANDLDMPKPGNYIEQEFGAVDEIPNNKRVQAYLRKVAKAFGVDSMHVVMHSKGGLDTRSYLANLYLEDKNTFKILSYTTLSTPHNGSILADMSSKYSEGVKKTARSPEFIAFPSSTAVLAALNDTFGGFTKGQENLTTFYVSEFNQRNIPKLRELASEIDFYTIAADADKNLNGEVDTLNCEQEGLAAEGVWTALPDCTPTVGSADTLYQILKKTKSIELSYGSREVYNDGIPISVIAPILTGAPNSTYQLNDTLVTIPSGHGAGSIFPLVEEIHRKTFRAGEGKNHASVANGSVAVHVITWILGTEQRKGDLKREP